MHCINTTEDLSWLNVVPGEISTQPQVEITVFERPQLTLKGPLSGMSEAHLGFSAGGRGAGTAQKWEQGSCARAHGAPGLLLPSSQLSSFNKQ